MAAPLLALPFLSNPLVLGALAVIGTDAYMILKSKLERSLPLLEPSDLKA